MNTKAKRCLCIFISILFFLSGITIPSIKLKATDTVDAFVERCYTVTLGRSSDPEGFADWKNQLLNGKAVGVHVAYGFLFSPEYTKKNKSNQDYVRDLYMLFMGRKPDEAGFQDWVGQLKSGKSRVEVFAGFANSQEFYNICESYGITAGRFVIGSDRFQINNVNLFVERLYIVCFRRIGDIGGQKNWVEKLIKKQITGSECARSFIQSQEYENLGLSDADYVENLYIALMGRASDAEGKANWVNGLAEGMTRDEVFAGFVNSVEFAQICNTYKIDRGSYTAKDLSKKISTSFKEVSFGNYEQDNNIKNGKEPIKWYVLDEKNGKCLLISKYVLDYQRYNDEYDNVTWEKASLRTWLNEEFIKSAFSERERSYISKTRNSTPDNVVGKTKGGMDTDDFVFLLSFEEYKEYFSANYEYYAEESDEEGVYDIYDINRDNPKANSIYSEEGIALPTIYSVSKSDFSREIDSNLYENKLKYYGYSKDCIGLKSVAWALRTPANEQNRIMEVDYGMAKEWDCNGPSGSEYGVRPAIWVDATKLKEVNKGLIDKYAYTEKTNVKRISRIKKSIEETGAYSLYEYDDKGNISEINKYYSNNILYTKVLYSYNEKGLLIKKTFIYYNKYGKEKSYKEIVEYEYNSNSQIIKESREDRGYSVYIYNSAGKLIEKKSYYEGKVYESYKYEYDSSGNIVKEDYYDENDKLAISSSYTYNENNQLQIVYCHDYSNDNYYINECHYNLYGEKSSESKNGYTVRYEYEEIK